MRELIRHILKENRVQQELKQVIKDGNIFDAADLVGGIPTLKKIFKDDPEMSPLFEKLTGTIIFDYYVNKEHIEFPLNYEIIGRKSNIHKTNHWPEINVIYDENKLDPEENDTFKSMIKNLADDAQHSGFKSKFDDGRIFNANYLTVVELNGENIDLIWGGHYPSIYEVEEIYDKLYGRTETLNESTFFRRRVDMRLMEKEFFETLNYVTDSFIYKLKKGIKFDFDTFKRRVINNLMDDYHDELSNGGQYDFPYDGIHKFLSNHFHDKIKDRYDLVFRRNINESEKKLNSPLEKLLNMLFDGFDDIYYDWANYMCGMGECCDPYAIGFVLPKSDYDDYIFKLVDSVNYDDDGDYPKELRDELPEVCYESPDIKNPDFDTIVFYGYYAEEIQDYMGHESNWKSDLLKIINNQFGCDAKRIIMI
jgi:hypothetical protein